MMERCYDEGTLQAFLDNELTPDETGAVARHVGECETCAALLADVEEESALVFAALGRELDGLVPTERLWTKINDSIETENRSRSLWTRLGAIFAGLGLTPFRVAAFASLVLVAGLAFFRFAGSAPDEAFVADATPSKVSAPVNGSNTAPVSAGPVVPAPDTVAPVVAATSPRTAPRVVKADYAARPKERISRQPNASNSGARPLNASSAPAVAAPFDGESAFVDTIARLEKTVNASKDVVLKPSSRVAYEKDMAVVNDTISKIREEVKRNPKNDDARELLFATYRNKIELLNSVSQRGELMASVR